MRVVHVIAGLGVGGAEHFLRRLVLSEQGATRTEHVVISLTTEGEVGKMLRDRGITVEALGMRSTLAVPASLLRLTRRLTALRPDVVQSWMYHADLLAGLAARWSRQGRVVWGVRASDLVAESPSTTRATRWLCARLSARLPDVIVYAAEAGRRAHEQLGYDTAKSRVIQNGFTFDDSASVATDAREVRAQLGWEPDVPVIGMVGRFHPIKGIDNFVRAAGLLQQRLPSARFLMVGRGMEAGNTELARWIGACDVPPQIALVGAQRDVPRFLAAMDVFVLSSRAEAFPNVVGEAMAVGVPCVVTDVGDAALLVGSTGHVVPRNDSVALAAGVERMLALSPEVRSALGEQARARVREEFSMERSGAKYRELYIELLSARSAAQ